MSVGLFLLANTVVGIMLVCFESTRSEGGMKFLLRCVAVVVEKDDVDVIDD